jgi:hypothetical protein
MGFADMPEWIKIFIIIMYVICTVLKAREMRN